MGKFDFGVMAKDHFFGVHPLLHIIFKTTKNRCPYILDSFNLMSLFFVVPPRNEALMVGTMAEWTRDFFPHFPPTGLAVASWDRKQRVDFVLCQSMTVHPYHLSDSFLEGFLRDHTFYPTFYPPDLQVYLPGGSHHGQVYHPDRYNTSAFVDPNTMEEGRPEWLQHHLPDFPRRANRNTAEWSQANRDAFLKAWDLENMSDATTLLSDSLHFPYPQRVPESIRHEATTEIKLMEEEKWNDIQRLQFEVVRTLNETPVCNGRPFPPADALILSERIGEKFSRNSE